MLEEIEKLIEAGIDSPHIAATLRVQLSVIYSKLAGSLESIVPKRPAILSQIREKVTTEAATARLWRSTELGVEEEMLELQMKRVDRLISGLSTLLKTFENEAKNIY